jgi:hypothetical protein
VEGVRFPPLFGDWKFVLSTVHNFDG